MISNKSNRNPNPNPNRDILRNLGQGGRKVFRPWSVHCETSNRRRFRRERLLRVLGPQSPPVIWIQCSDLAPSRKVPSPPSGTLYPLLCSQVMPSTSVYSGISSIFRRSILHEIVLYSGRMSSNITWVFRKNSQYCRRSILQVLRNT